MKLKTLAFLSAALLTACSSQNHKNEEFIYSSPEFSISKNEVVQGKFTAEIIGSKQISSDYQSPKHLNYSPVIDFKFAINQKDNELDFGVNHRVFIQPNGNEYETPIIKFGEQFSDQNQPTDNKPLAPNTKVTFRLDMNEVLKSFEEKGFYETIHGDKIAKVDFKEVCIAGGSYPLRWDFENLGGNNGERLTDEDNDGIYETTIVLNPHNEDLKTKNVWTLEEDISNFPQLNTDIPLMDAAYNLTLEEVIKLSEADGTFRTGEKWAGVWTRDVSYAIILGLAQVDPERCKTSLRKKVKRNRIVQDTGSGGAWPVSTDRIVWTLAAWEIYKVTGDNDWLEEVFQIIKNTVDDDLEVIWNTKEIVKGETSFTDWRKQTYPRWMDNVDISQSTGLSTNIVYYQSLKILHEMGQVLGKENIEKYNLKADHLKAEINANFWLEDKGYYAQYQYGRFNKITSPNSEALGEAFAVLFGIGDQKRSNRVIANTPNMTYGIPTVYPQLNGIPPYHNDSVWPFVQMFWNLAAAQVGNEAILEHGLASIYRALALFLTNKENMVASTGDFAGTELNSNYQLWSVAGSLGLVYKIFFGMDFQAEQLKFSPVIPQAYQGQKTLTNFTYRNAILDITISGHGNKIKSFKVDGIEQDAAISSSLEGKHQIEIQLANNSFKDAPLQLVENHVMLPTPETTLTKNIISWEKIEGAQKYEIFVNGKLKETTDKTSIKIEEQNFQEVSVRAIDTEGFVSFLSEPIKVYNEKNESLIEAERFAKISDKKLTDFTGIGAIEISKLANRNFVFDVKVPADGEYLIDFRYSNGSGPWNTDNKCALRTLFLENNKIGSVVMAQRGTDEWSNWSYSNSNKVYLKKGKNQLSLKFEDYDENMNVDINNALIDYIRLIKL
ncbi:alpha-L-rhamnosidase-related protein [Sediminitomix flava]|uniref:Alpha-L-rhamnosidase-like protein n=1 Tax=Sediminitomix flava TaxID=379075 RepID=A0A315ZFS7_SEDFL|nr:family 78 glycoside hydrolase catalytic domain [Sediminitomix flava]PWJ44162.1 alpha-L-rhamnosidase-like protein [Sediminitomix flava]